MPRTCEVGLNDNGCTAPPRLSASTRATCYRCGNPACTNCSRIVSAWTFEQGRSGKKRIRICNDCMSDEPIS